MVLEAKMKRRWVIWPLAVMFGLSSCSNTEHLGLVDPTALRPDGHAEEPPHAMLYTIGDSTNFRRVGWLVAEGDSFASYRASVSEQSITRSSGAPHFQRDRAWSEVPIMSYMTADGRHHNFQGVMRARGDSLEMFAKAIPARHLEGGQPAQTVRLSRASVASVQADLGANIGDTIFVLALTVAVITGLTLLGISWAY
jgi:hypothetical protein